MIRRARNALRRLRRGGRRPRLLVMSFTDLSRDPRAIKQIRAAVADFDVVTCGFGPQPHPEVEHLRLDPDGAYPTSDFMYRVDRAARRYDQFWWTYRRIPFVREARALLRHVRVDAVVANNPDSTLTARRALPGVPLHIDLHEYFPGIVFDDGSDLAAKQQRYHRWLLRRTLRHARSTSTLGPLIAQRYREWGIAPLVVTNAGPSRALRPGPVGDPIRLVHSGNAQRGRGLRRMIRAVGRAEAAVTLDLYLVPNDARVHAEIAALAASYGDRVRLHPPVPAAELVDTLHAHDVGIFVVPPDTVNAELVLPNKFFDFVQARLAILVGPSPEMAGLVRRHDLGVVTDDFSEDAVVRAVEALTSARVAAAKEAAHAVAGELSGDAHEQLWARIAQALVARRR